MKLSSPPTTSKSDSQRSRAILLLILDHTDKMKNGNALSESESIELLAQIFPFSSATSLSSILSSCGGDLTRATNVLLSSESAKGGTGSSGSNNKRKVGGGLDAWLSGGTIGSSNQSKKKRDDREKYSEGPRIVKGTPAPNGSNAFNSLLPPPPVEASTNRPPLDLETAEMIHLHTGGLCKLVLNVLPKDLASRLFLKMVKESVGDEGEAGWDKNRWMLNDKFVESPHTSSFYYESRPTTLSSKTTGYDIDGFMEAARYWYNGEERDARMFNEEMNEARELIEPIVRDTLAQRPKHPLSSSLPWTPNVAAANCYRGSKESVGWHSDVLTYLGPLPVIASISLGVERVFRLRSTLSSSTSPAQTMSISLPHNSLLMMLSGCQEQYKHCIMPAPARGALDLFRLPKSTIFPSSEQAESNDRGWKERINITFRSYRRDFAPLPKRLLPNIPPSNSGQPPLSSPYAGTPICRCGIPTSLRPDAKGKALANLVASSSPLPPKGTMLYFWTCNAAAQDNGSCGYFRILDYEKEGRGDFFVGSQ